MRVHAAADRERRPSWCAGSFADLDHPVAGCRVSPPDAESRFRLVALPAVGRRAHIRRTVVAESSRNCQVSAAAIG
jgi:hypothetical protein